jgi:superfamily II DNA/RNA helicase
MGFESLGLSQKVLDAVEASGYTEPTQIQAEAIPHVLQRRDVLGIAQTGTGKTASFVLPMLTLLGKGRARARMPRTLILEPTRELAAQVAENFEKYGAKQKLSMALLIGGVSFEEQDRKLTRGVDVLIATPGRLLDHFQRGKLLMTGVDIFVIDEADRMLDMGFIPDIERISKMIPFTRQTLFFSATMPPEINNLANQFLQNPVSVEVAKASSTAATITQRVVATGGKDYDKRATLRQLVDTAENLKNGIIFCNRKRDVETVYKSLKKYGYSVGALHGDMDQRARMETLAGFKNNDITLLVASDVAARGLDIPDVSHVFNYDLPTSAEDYVHRIGRTGRAGREGASFSLVAKADSKYLEAIEKLIDRKIEWQDKDVSALSEDEAEEPKRGRHKASPKSETQSDDGEDEGKSRTRRRGRGGKKPSEEAVTVDASEKQEEEVAAQAKPNRRRRKPDNDDASSTPANTAVKDNQPTEQPSEAQARSEQTDTRSTNNSGNRSENNRSDNNRSDNNRSRGGRGRNRNNDLGPSVIGFGDHMPAFVLRTFDLPEESETSDEPELQAEAG